MKICNNVERFRKERGMTWFSLAKASGVSRGTIYRFEKTPLDTVGATIETAMKLSKALNVSLDDLFYVMEGECN